MTEIEDILDSIRVLLRQEEKHYRCEDYVVLQHQQQQEQLSHSYGDHNLTYCSPLHVVAECANLVTDGPLTPIPTAEDYRQIHAKSGESTHSPAGVVSKVPSARSIQDLLYSSSPGNNTCDTLSKQNKPYQMDRIASFSSNGSADYFYQYNINTLSGGYGLSEKQSSSLSIWRSQMFDWCISVIQSFHLPREVVAIAFDMLDRHVASECREVAQEFRKQQPQRWQPSLSSPSYDDMSLTREDFQLFAMVSLYMAIKMTASYQKMSVNVLIDMSRGFYSVHDILSTEREILMSLNWHVNPPTIMAYCKLYTSLFRSDTFQSTPNFVLNLEASCQVLSELALADTYFLSKSNASVALAVVLLSGRRESIPLVDMQQFMDTLEYSENEENCDNHCSLLQSITCHTKAGADFECIFRRLESLC